MVDGKQISWTGFSGTIEVSDLGFAPGEWPEWIDVKGKSATKRFYRSEATHDREGELVSVTYVHKVHFVTASYPVFTIVVFND